MCDTEEVEQGADRARDAAHERRGRIALALLAALASGCGASHGADSGPPRDAGHDGEAALDFCDDSIFEADGIAADIVVSAGGGACERPQYPLGVGTLDLQVAEGTEDGPELYRSVEVTCWRVTEAAPGSGWTVGEIVASERQWARVGVIGFGRPVAFEGRAVRADGAVVFSIPEGVVELPSPTVLMRDAGDLVAVMGRHAWATADRITAFGETIAPRGTIIDATARWEELELEEVVTLERTDAVVSARVYGAGGEVAEIVLGEAERVLLARGGAAVALDAELIWLEHAEAELAVADRASLVGPPDAIVAGRGWTLAQIGGDIVARRRGDGAEHVVAEGRTLLEGPYGSYAFDGVTFSRLLVWDDRPPTLEGSFGDVVPAIGEPLFLSQPVVIGRDGFSLLRDLRPTLGPSVATIGDVLGGGRVSLVSEDGLSYVVMRDDGAATLYEVRHYGGPPVTCD